MSLVRVMTYNILLGGQRETPLHHVVRDSRPDVLLVNECPKSPLLWKRRCEGLASKWDMEFVAGGRPAGSNMISVRSGVGVKSVSSERLPQPLFQPRRGIASAQVRVHGRLLGVVSCHLSLDRERRAEEVGRVIAAAGRLRGPVVLAGDLNEPPDGPSWRTLRQAGFVDHGGRSWRTFPAQHPNRRIDALLVRGEVTVLRHGDPGVDEELLATASDHRPVLAEIEI